MLKIRKIPGQCSIEKNWSIHTSKNGSEIVYDMPLIW
jgi:hypothetical protein